MRSHIFTWSLIKQIFWVAAGFRNNMKLRCRGRELAGGNYCNGPIAIAIHFRRCTLY